MNTIKSVQYAGHSAVLLHCDDYVIGIDPWLEGNPFCPKELINPEQLDLIVLTHGHSDHAGDTVRLALKYKSKVAATFELASILAGEGVPESQLIFMNKGGTVSVDGLTISLTNAFHSSSFDSPKRGTLYAGEPCGVVIRDGKNSIYHAGDTSLFLDMVLIKENYQPQIAFLPIGDCFTMNPKEAAKAAAILEVKIAIPIHFGTFPLLTGTPKEFTSECKEVNVLAEVLTPGGELLIK